MGLDKRIQLLLATHSVCTTVILGMAFSSFISSIATTLLRVLVSAQICLIGTWCAFGIASWRGRLGGMLVGVVYGAVLSSLSISLQLALQGPRFWSTFPQLALTFAIMVSCGMLGVVSALLIIRRARTMRLIDCRSQATSPDSEGLQFSILQLMILTAVVAVVVMIGKYVRSLFGPDLQTIFTNSLLVALFGVMQLAMAVAYTTAIALMALWATLAGGRPAARVLVALLLSLAIGLITPFYFSQGWTSFLVSPLFTAGTSAVVIASLLVVRSCGYRLVGAPATRL